MDTLIELWASLPVVIQIVIKIMVIMLPLMGLVAYYTCMKPMILRSA